MPQPRVELSARFGAARNSEAQSNVGYKSTLDSSPPMIEFFVKPADVVSVGADLNMPRRDRAQIDLRRLPHLLRYANRGLALDCFADLACRSDVAAIKDR